MTGETNVVIFLTKKILFIFPRLCLPSEIIKYFLAKDISVFVSNIFVVGLTVCIDSNFVVFIHTYIFHSHKVIKMSFPACSTSNITRITNKLEHKLYLIFIVGRMAPSSISRYHFILYKL